MLGRRTRRALPEGERFRPVQHTRCDANKSAAFTLEYLPMDTTSVFAIAFAVGVIAGLRTFTAPMVVSLAASLKWLHLEDTWAALLGYTATPYVMTASGAAICAGAQQS